MSQITGVYNLLDKIYINQNWWNYSITFALFNEKKIFFATFCQHLKYYLKVRTL